MVCFDIHRTCTYPCEISPNQTTRIGINYTVKSIRRFVERPPEKYKNQIASTNFMDRRNEPPAPR